MLYKEAVLDLRLATSQRVSHQLWTHVLAIFLREVLGYANVTVNQPKDMFHVPAVLAELADRYLRTVAFIFRGTTGLADFRGTAHFWPIGLILAILRVGRFWHFWWVGPILAILGVGLILAILGVGPILAFLVGRTDCGNFTGRTDFGTYSIVVGTDFGNCFKGLILAAYY